jgi:PAS domain-containing protein
MKTDWASMLMEDTGPQPDGLGTSFWTVPSLPYEVSQRVHVVFEVLSHLPLRQPVVVVSDVGKTMALNAPLLELTGGEASDYIGRQWSVIMSSWPERARGFRREGIQSFEDYLTRRGAEPLWVRVSFGPVFRRGETRPVAYVLFLSSPDAETIDHQEVRRLRKSLQLFAELQSDYVVELDGDGLVRFASPSFCQAVGAPEGELLGRPFLARLRAEDRAEAHVALGRARRPPFSGEMRARLAADPDVDVTWQVDTVVGPGYSGLDLVGRVQTDVPRPAKVVAPVALRAVPAGDAAAVPVDPRLDAIRERLDALVPGDQASLLALARAVASAADAECVLYNVLNGDTIEPAVGWRLPPAP